MSAAIRRGVLKYVQDACKGEGCAKKAKNTYILNQCPLKDTYSDIVLTEWLSEKEEKMLSEVESPKVSL